MAKTKKTQGKLARYVNTPEAMEKFRRHYGVPDDVYLEYRFWEDAITGEPGDLIIPVVAVIEGGVRFPMDPLLADFLDYFRISPSQISPNIFRIVNGVAELNRRLGFNLTVHDIIATYFLRTTQHEAFSLRPRDISNTLVNSLPDTNKEMMDDFLLVRGNWYFPGHRCPTRDGKPVKFCVDEYANPRSAYKLLRYIPSARSFLQCRQVRNLAEALANPANKSPPAHDIRAMAGINLKKLLPPRPQAETSEPILPLKRKRKGVPKGEASQAATPVEPDTTSAASKVPEARPVLPGVDTLPSTEDEDVEMVGPFIPARDPINAAVLASILGTYLGSPGRKGEDGRHHSPDRSLRAVQGSLEIGRWRPTRSRSGLPPLKKDEADLKLEDSQDLLKKALEENSKAGDKILALEAEITARERAAFDRGSVEAQTTMTKQLPGIYNEAFQVGWKALYSWESDDMPPLPPQDVLPYPNAPIGVPEEELPEVQPANDDVAGPSNS
uniref:Uncharacterized protein n=1 Tax=Fagus sylvatica TaxID=28930 RepID=A0A2N9IQB2_FAGSY